MGFIQEQLPPIIENAIKEIENRNGEVTHKEFNNILYKLRITSKDTTYYKKLLEAADKIKIKKHKIILKHNTIENIILLTCYDCGYEWQYTGQAERAECPACRYRHNKKTWIKTNINILPQKHNILPQND